MAQLSIRPPTHRTAATLEPAQRRAWTAEAACRGIDPALFFPSGSLGVEAAQSICQACPVRAECLDHALEHHINNGVWGGVSERARRRIQQHAHAT